MAAPRLRTVMNSAPRGDYEPPVDETTRPKSTLPAEYEANPFLRPSDIAKEMSVDPKTVTRWVKKGKFGEAPDVINLPGSSHRRIRQSAYERAKREALEQARS